MLAERVVPVAKSIAWFPILAVISSVPAFTSNDAVLAPAELVLDICTVPAFAVFTRRVPVNAELSPDKRITSLAPALLVIVSVPVPVNEAPKIERAAVASLSKVPLPPVREIPVRAPVKSKAPKVTV